MVMQFQSENNPLRSNSFLYAGGNQPSRRDFGISTVGVGREAAPVQTLDLAATPFFHLTEFSRTDVADLPGMLIIAPLSGHFPVVMRDLVLGLLPFFKVYVTDWLNVRHVPAHHRIFGLEDNICAAAGAIRSLPPGLTVLGLCQGGVPALAATALLATHLPDHAPSSLVLVGAPIDPFANPTGVAQLARTHPLSWFETNFVKSVPRSYAGAGRRVYPAQTHVMPLWMYLAKRLGERGEIRRKVFFDDGADSMRFPFVDLYTSIMDLDAAFFLENTNALFLERLLPRGLLRVKGQAVEPRAIERTALLTIEGDADDVVAPGQTAAAHALCEALPDERRGSLVVQDAGHFSLFHGNMFRRYVLPVIADFATHHAARS
jgi:poly(3-hydroxybutyrate) depolymerase